MTATTSVPIHTIDLVTSTIEGLGAVLVETGAHIGRSPLDKYFVRTPCSQDNIWWDNNGEMSPEAFNSLYCDMAHHKQGQVSFF